MIEIMIGTFLAGLLLAAVVLLATLAARDPNRDSLARTERRQPQTAATAVYIVLPPAAPAQPAHVEHTHTHYLVRDEPPPPAAQSVLPVQPQRRALPAPPPPAVWVEPQPARRFRVVGETEPWYDADADAGPIVVHGRRPDDD